MSADLPIDVTDDFTDGYGVGFRRGWRMANEQWEALFIANGYAEAADFVRGLLDLHEAQHDADVAAAQGKRQ